MGEKKTESSEMSKEKKSTKDSDKRRAEKERLRETAERVRKRMADKKNQTQRKISTSTSKQQ